MIIIANFLFFANFMIKIYYQVLENEKEIEEADKLSARITELLCENSFNFNPLITQDEIAILINKSVCILKVIWLICGKKVLLRELMVKEMEVGL